MTTALSRPPRRQQPSWRRLSLRPDAQRRPPALRRLHRTAALARLCTGTGVLRASILAGVLGAGLLGAGAGAIAIAGGPAGAGSPDPGPAARAGSAGPGLTLVKQPWTVGPGQDFSITVALGTERSGTGAGQGVTTGAGPTSGTGAAAGVGRGDLLQLQLYSPLHTRSALAQAVGGSVSGFVSYRSVTPLRDLPSPLAGQYQESLSLVTPDDPTPPTGATAGPAPLDCQTSQPGSCGGVYPVVLELQSPSGALLSSLVTFLVYAYPAASPYRTAMPLRLATVVPLDVPAAAGGTVSGAALSQLERVAAATTTPASAGVPLTVVPEPAALVGLQHGGGTADRAALAAVDAAAADPAHEVLSQGYVPVDATALVDAGLGSELSAQVTRACAVLAADHPTPGTWVAAAGLDQSAAAALASLPCDAVRHLVVPAGSVTGGGCKITCAAPFTVSTSAGTLTAATADSQLATEATSGPADPVLRAHDLIGDLSLTYFEAPTPTDPRGVVLALPPGAAVPPTELADLLAGVVADPVLAPVTLDQYFTAVPVGANGQPAVRRLDGSVGTLAAATVRNLRRARTDLTAWGGAVDATPAGAAAATSLDDRLLAAESALLRPVQQRQALAAFAVALHRQLARVTLSTGLVRLTSSSTLRVPITLASSAGFPVEGTLVVSSDKLLFSPGGQCHGIDRGPAGYDGLSCPVDLDKSTNAVYVAVRARTNGDFRVAVSLAAPDGRLTLAHGNLTVRSLSTSVEGVVLSVAALVVLLTWWARTSWRSRRRGRHTATSRRAARRPAGAEPVTSPSGPW